MKIYLCTTCDKTVPLKKLGEHREHCTTELALEKGGTGQGSAGRFWRSLVAVLLAVTSIVLGFVSFSSVKSMRQLERIPATEVHAVLPGEANLSGKALRRGAVLSAPKSGKRCFYYRYLVEREERDSDGDRTWRTIQDDTNWAEGFTLSDDTGKLPVFLSGEIDVNVPQSFRTRSGDLRYTEWRVDVGDQVFVFGSVSDKQGRYELHFDAPGHYDPIISKYDEASERLDMAGASILQCWGSLVLLAFAVAFALRACGIHRLLAFFAVLSTVILVVLSSQGLMMMVGDLKAGSERLTRHKAVAETLITKELASASETWDGTWTSLTAFEAYEELPKKKAVSLRRIRLDLAVATDRVQEQRATFPENVVAVLAGVPRHADLPIPSDEWAALDELKGAHVKAKVPQGIALGVIGGSILIGLLSFWCGFRNVRDKRCMENVPTSKTAGAVFGLAEFKGIVGPAPNEVPLTSPLTQTPCVYYHYVVKEKRGSGKKSKWVTILNEKDYCDCTCIDGEGSIEIDTDGAKVMTKHHTTKRRGRYRYSEHRLEVHDPLYVIGTCSIHPDHADRLYLRKPEGSFPFILSNLTEKAVTETIAGRGIAQLNLAFASVLLIGLTLFGLFGSFGADDYLASAMLAPIFMFFITLVLHFNDLVFLRQRVNRNASNIDVSLKKRHDLLPSLEQIVKTYMSHEADVMESLTKMRTAYAQQNTKDPNSVGQYLTAEYNAVSTIMARMEAYPDLKGSQEAGILMRAMVSLENEIALMREGYNHAVETYNTRIETLPDMLFAKACGFKERAFIQAEVGELVVPTLRAAEPDVASGVESGAASQRALSLLEPLTDGQLDASAAIYAALLNEDAETRNAQLALIRDHHDAAMVERTELHVASIDGSKPNDLDRLKHAENWYSVIQELSDDQYRTFNTVARELAEADDVISLFECALQYSVATRLDALRGKQAEQPVWYDSLNLLTQPIAVVLSTLMHMEDDVATTGSGAFDKALVVLEGIEAGAVSPLSGDACNLSAFDAAIMDLQRAAEPVKAKVLEACIALVADNNDYTHEQALLIIMIADSLSQDRPDWL